MIPIGKPASILIVVLLIIDPLEGIGLIEILKSNYQIEIDSNQRREDNSISFIEHVVKFENTSEQDILIKQIDSDDRVCIAKDWKRGVIHPGENGYIRLRQKNIPASDGDESIVHLGIVFGFENGKDKKVNFEIKRKVKEKD